MPITHHFDRELNILFVTRSGSISSQDEQRALRERQANPLIVPGIPVLVDCRHVDPADSRDTVKYISEKVTQLASRIRCGPLAIVVVSDSAEYGMARMFQALIEAAHPDTEIFRDYGEALRWIEKKRAE